MPANLITSRANPRVKQLRAAFAGHARLSGGLVAIEGEHLISEAKRSGLAFKTIFLSERAVPPAWMPHSVELIELSDEVFLSVVDTQSPQGIAALLVPPQWTIDDAFPALSRSTKQAPLLLIAAGLQDPGNLGTLIRSAEAFAAAAVLTTAGTVSPWNQKALRASAGSIFRMPVICCTVADLAALKLKGLHLYAAAAAGPDPARPDPAHPARAHPDPANPDPADPDSHSLAAADLTQPCALMIGNEGAGLTEDLLQLADARISIPTPGPVESLNAAIAGSLLLYEASRQRIAAHANERPATDNQQPLL